MPDIRPRRKSIPLVSELVSAEYSPFFLFLTFFITQIPNSIDPDVSVDQIKESVAARFGRANFQFKKFVLKFWNIQRIFTPCPEFEQCAAETIDRNNKIPLIRFEIARNQKQSHEIPQQIHHPSKNAIVKLCEADFRWIQLKKQSDQFPVSVSLSL